MNTIRVSATKARNNFFELLNQVALGDTEVVIERDTKEVAVLSPSKEQNIDWKAFKKALKEAHGILKDYSIEEIAPASKKGAWRDPDYYWKKR